MEIMVSSFNLTTRLHNSTGAERLLPLRTERHPQPAAPGAAGAAAPRFGDLPGPGVFPPTRMALLSTVSIWVGDWCVAPAGAALQAGPHAPITYCDGATCLHAMRCHLPLFEHACWLTDTCDASLCSLQWTHEQMSELAAFNGEDFGQHTTPSEPPHAALLLHALWRGAAAGPSLCIAGSVGKRRRALLWDACQAASHLCCPEPASGPSPVLIGVLLRSARTASLPSSRYHKGCRSDASWPAAAQPGGQPDAPSTAYGPCGCACRVPRPACPLLARPAYRRALRPLKQQGRAAGRSRWRPALVVRRKQSRLAGGAGPPTFASSQY